MIPKVIHYCWFGGVPKSAFIKKCMKTWHQYMPDYEIKEWNEKTFDINSVPFVRDAYKAKKWAFVADYVRLYALYTEGGIYMDTDVKVMKPFNEFLTYNFFSAHEKHDFFYNAEEQNKIDENKHLKANYKYVEGFGILSAIMGACPKLSYIKDCMQYYNQMSFNLDTHNLNSYIIGKHITYVMCKYGYRFIDEKQLLKDNMLILESSVLVGNSIYLKPDSYAVHLCNGSWTDDSNSFNHYIRNHFPRISPLYFFIIKVWKHIFR